MSVEDYPRPSPSSPTLWRRVLASSWAEPTSPAVYARVDIDVTDVEVRLKEMTTETGTKITLTGLMTWALSRAIASIPDCNAIVRNGEIKQLPSIDINVTVASPESERITPIKIPNADQMTLEEIASMIKKDSQEAKKKQASSSNSYSLVDWLMPAGVVRFFQNTGTALETDWGIKLSWLGIDSVPYQPASALITCIHRFGLDEAFATFPTVLPVPLIVSVGNVTLRPWVVKDRETKEQKIEARRILTLCFTVDNRVFDGRSGGKLAALTRKNFYSILKQKRKEPPRSKL